MKNKLQQKETEIKNKNKYIANLEKLRNELKTAVTQSVANSDKFTALEAQITSAQSQEQFQRKQAKAAKKNAEAAKEEAKAAKNNAKAARKAQKLK